MRLFVEGGYLSPPRLAFRKPPLASVQYDFIPLQGLRHYGPYKQLPRLRVVHIIPEKPTALNERISKIRDALENTIKSNLQTICKVGDIRVDKRKIDKMDNENIEAVIKQYSHGKENLVILIPIFRDVFGHAMAKQLYYHVKGLTLRYGVLSQVYTERTERLILLSREAFPLLNLSLNIFCKAGGVPWALYDGTGANVIIGLNWSFSRDIEARRTGPICKIFAYAHTFDEGGVYQRMYGAVIHRPEEYIRALKALMNRALIESRRKSGIIERIVIFTAKRLRKSQIRELSRVCSDISLIIALITDTIRIRAFDTLNESYTISRGTYLIIDDRRAFYAPYGTLEVLPHGGVIMGTPILIKIELLHPIQSARENKALLRTLVNISHGLSAMNWRTFRGMSRMPVPLYYAKLVANFIKEYTMLNRLETAFPIESEGLFREPAREIQDKPWFL